MINLNKVEMENLRNLIIKEETSYNKLINYAEYAVDPQIKQIFNKAAQDKLKNREKLIDFLNDQEEIWKKNTW